MDSLEFWYRQAGDPFPATWLVTTVSAQMGGTVGDCFVLVENGKVFFSGQRTQLDVALASDAGHDNGHQLLKVMGHQLLTRMYRASQRRGVSPAHSVSLNEGFEPADLMRLTELCGQTDYAVYLRWLADKAASPALRSLLKQHL